MISVNQLTVDFGGFRLFDEISFLINPRDRIGLVGKNGAGKSTLLKIIAGQLQPSAGTVSLPKALTLGYLPQHLEYDDPQTVRQEAERAVSDLIASEGRIERLTNEVAERTNNKSGHYLQTMDGLTTR